MAHTLNKLEVMEWKAAASYFNLTILMVCFIKSIISHGFPSRSAQKLLKGRLDSDEAI